MLRDLSLHILDLGENSVRAKASEIKINIKKDEKYLSLSIEDNGKGMGLEVLEKVMDPFTTSRTTRDVGLGIPFFKDACELAGGSLKLESKEGLGTKIEGSMLIDHIDRLPLGDVGEAYATLILFDTAINYVITIENLADSFTISTDDIKNELGDVDISEFSVVEWIKDFINSYMEGIIGDI